MKKIILYLGLMVTIFVFGKEEAFDFWSLTNQTVLLQIRHQELDLPLPTNKEIDDWFVASTNSINKAWRLENVLKGLGYCLFYNSYPTQEVDRVCARCLINTMNLPVDYEWLRVSWSGLANVGLMNGVLSLPGMRANPDVICQIADYIGAIPTVSDAELAAANLTLDSYTLHVLTCRTEFASVPRTYCVVTHQTQPPLVRQRKALDKYRSMWVQDVLWEAAVRKEPTPSGFESYESFKSNIIARARLSSEEASGLFTKKWKKEVPLYVRDLDWYYDMEVDVEGLE